MNAKKLVILIIHASVVWVLCGVTMMIGPSVMSMEATLIAHAVGAPLFAALVSFVYFRRFGYTTPLQTALTFLLFIVVMDAALVAPLFEKSYEMFLSPLGTWIPLSAIFLSTYVTGSSLTRPRLSI